jgi:RNA polymerase sigma-70 factor (ECF subfamily)
MDRIPNTRASLILRLPTVSDAAAWREFTEIYEPFVYRFARRKGLQHADACELTQEVFLAVARAIGRYEIDADRAQFRTWLFRIARNCLLKQWAKQRRAAVPVDSGTWQQISEALAEPLPDLQEEDYREYRREVLNYALLRVQRSVKPLTWRAFCLTALQQRSIDDAAAELHVNRGAVYVARSRVISRLRDEVVRLEQELA